MDVYADFFAYKKLEHPQTHKVIYLLYDIHASIIADADVQKRLLDGMGTIIDNAIADAKKIEQPKAVFSHLKETFNKMDQQADLMRNNLPNLVKQHNDLIYVVKKYQISLIDEDWRDSQEQQAMFPLGGGAGKFWRYIAHSIGNTKQYKNSVFQEAVSPILGIGKSLTGKFSAHKFEQLDGSAYFYNADTRGGAIGEGGKEKVDDFTLNAIETLFTTYNQKSIIISQGYEHIIAVSQQLCTKKGYNAGPLIISDDLQKQRAQSSTLNAFLKALEMDNYTDLKKINMDDRLTYFLIAQPLDIQTLFEKELNVTEQQKKLTVQFTKNKKGMPTCIIWLKKEDGELLGTLTFTYDVLEQNAHLIQIGVIDEYQASGFGTKLWDKMVEELKTLKIKKITFTAVPPIDSMNPEWETRLNKLVDWYKNRGAKVVKIEDKTPFMEYDVEPVNITRLNELLAKFKQDVTALYLQTSYFKKA
jgi:hypothetical protein